MATEDLARPGSPPFYRAEVPWIGPVLGPLDDATGLRSIGGTSDPLLGDALAAVFLTVKYDDTKTRLIPADADGQPADILQVARVAWFISDSKGRFRVQTKVEPLPQALAGVFMALIYDLTGALRDAADATKRIRFPRTWRAQVSALGKEVETDSGEEVLSQLPEAAAQAIRRCMEKLLQEPLGELERGLIQLPPHNRAKFNFAVASCQYPAGFLDRRVAEASYERLASAAGPLPQCLLLIGDQIYSDATAGLFDPTTRYDRFDLPHERLLRIEALRKVMRRIPTYMMLDDHEIEDNWEPRPDAWDEDDNLVDGRSAYLGYQRLAGPPQIAARGDSTNPLWYWFEIDGFPFFMADSRSERKPRTAQTIDSACIMSETQFQALLDWLDEQDAKNRYLPKFIASPACLLPRHLRGAQRDRVSSALRSDAWDGYPHSLKRLLAHIVQKQMLNVVFLSGDEHISFAADVTIVEHRSRYRASIQSIHSSGLYSPFPFANSMEESIACEESFYFELLGLQYTGHVCTRTVVKGDGFARIDVQREDGRWKVEPVFDRASPV